MPRWDVTFTLEGSVEIEADTYEEAERLKGYSLRELAEICGGVLVHTCIQLESGDVERGVAATNGHSLANNDSDRVGDHGGD